MTATTRETKYKQALVESLQRLKHATNAQLLSDMRKEFPDLSATTVHRLTARLASRGTIGLAPSADDGSLRYDTNTASHDHFVCGECGNMRDIDVAKALIPTIQEALGGCKITGRLVVHGTCQHCLRG